MKNRIIAGILAGAMSVSCFISILPSVFAAGDTITIASAQDFIEFSKKCTLDTWSLGKTVNLACDIDFEDSEFVPVPTFCGTFNGNGYTISAINISKNGSYLGVFRYVREGGKVSNLNVKASIIPNGSRSFIGGIAGENRGTVEGCTFEGTVKGENVIGGIAGNNSDSGRIISCSSSGNIAGENSTGGIVGKNSGFIRDCTNDSSVNTVYDEKKKDITQIETDTGAIIENYKINSEENEEESVLGHSDTGGVAGYSSGVMQGCTNNADVGYKHIGYNVGGIVGRQSGYMLGCRNYGFIQGRKDVGGIAGQLEPYVLLNVTENGLKDIRHELNNLNSMVNRFITDVDGFGDDTENHLSEISRFAKNARDNAQTLINQGTDFVDDNLGEINAQAAILSNTIDKLTPVFENMENGTDKLGNALDDITAAIDEIELYTPDLSDEMNKLNTALGNVSNAQNSIKRAVSRANKAINRLKEVIVYDNQTEADKALSELSQSIKEIIDARKTIKASLEEIKNILSGKPESFEGIFVNAKKIAEDIGTVIQNMDKTISSLETVKNSIDTLKQNGKIDFSAIRDAADGMKSSMEYLVDAMTFITRALEGMGTAVMNISDSLEEYADDVSKDLEEVKVKLEEAINSLSYAADDITTAIGDAKDILNDLSDEETISFVKLGDDFKAASDELFNSVSGISGELEKLKDTVSGDRGIITNNLTSISNQFKLLTELMADEVDSFQNESADLSNKFLDVSDEDIENSKQGKAAECHNFGEVQADRNIGGIAGAMAVEYSSDPEDDIEKPDTLNFTYRSKAILHSCINDGKIVGKKDCTGGIAGLSEIGTIYECENYGDIESTNGNYIGGVAGKSDSSIRKSFSKSSLSGKRYVGGIAGKGETVTSCYTIVNVSGDENTGAVCGDVSDIYKCRFIDNGLGAVDGISYESAAEPISFERLKDMGGIPARFISFSVTFIADDKTVEVQEVKYGEKTAEIQYPEIPQKDGCFGNWRRIEAETVTENIDVYCDYEPYITVLSSVEKKDDGKLSLALAEGEFTDKAVLHILKSGEEPPKKSEGGARVYDVSLLYTDITDSDTVTLRILNEDKEKVTAWQLKNGNWKQISSSERGKYVVVKAEGAKSTICLKYEGKRYGIVWTAAIMIVITVIVLIIIKKRRRKSKRRKNK